jgi:hypothetical protein
MPEVKKMYGKPWLRFGDNNDFPDTLLYLYNKSAKHNAIINGKVGYILGNGLSFENEQAKAWAQNVNRYGESLQDVANKLIADCELFGGFYLEEVWGQTGQLVEIYHHEFNTVRVAEDYQNFYIKNDWSSYKEETLIIPATGKNNTGRTMRMFKEYRSGSKQYPIPNYIGCLNYLETDVEISKFHLSSIKNGLFPSWAVTFNNGVPDEEGKAIIEQGIKKKFSGAENAGSFWLMFNDDPAKAPIFQDLSNTNLDKHFDILSKRVQDEIFIGHGVTNGMLFGVKTEGQLGAANELKTSYEVFQNTYINKKQRQAERYLNSIVEMVGISQPGVSITPTDPVGITFTEAIISQVAPKAWLLEKIGINPEDYPELQQPAEGAAPSQAMVNDNIKNLTGRQYQQLTRIIREFTKGKITEAQAKSLLKTGLGLNDEECATMLGTDEPTAFGYQYSEQETADMFLKFGEDLENYEVVYSGNAAEGLELEMQFAETANNEVQANILDLVKKNKRITIPEIAKVLEVSIPVVNANLAVLDKNGLLKIKTYKIGQDTITERELTKPLAEAVGQLKPETKQIFIRYTYEVLPGVGDPVIPTTRPFCKAMVQNKRYWSRVEIEQISERVGFSIWDRRGGWWGNSPTCRHFWKVNVLTKKRK